MASIPKLLTTVGAVAVGGAVLVGATGVLAERALADGTSRTERAGRALRAVTLADMAHDGLRAEVYGYLLATDDAARAEARAGVDGHARVLEGLAREPDVVGLEGSRRAVEAVAPAVARYVATGRALVGGQADPAARAAFEQQFRALGGDLEAAADAVEAEAGAITGDAVAAGGRLTVVLVAVTLLVAAATGALVVSIRRRILRDVRAITDEIGPASTAVIELGRRLQGLVEETASSTREAVEEGARVSSALGSTAAAVEELVASVGEIAQRAAEAADMASQGVVLTDGTSRHLGELDEAGAQISRVVEAIAGIAEQTSLLALNATLEAARAGEAGKGFAVVAAEVKNLAHSSATASEQVIGQVKAISSGTMVAVESLAAVTDAVQRIEGSQAAIAAAVEEQSATTSEINRTLHEVAADSARAAQRFERLASQAGDLEEAVTRTESVAGTFTSVTRRLGELVGTRGADG